MPDRRGQPIVDDCRSDAVFREELPNVIVFTLVTPHPSPTVSENHHGEILARGQVQVELMQCAFVFVAVADFRDHFDLALGLSCRRRNETEPSCQKANRQQSSGHEHGILLVCFECYQPSTVCLAKREWRGIAPVLHAIRGFFAIKFESSGRRARKKAAARFQAAASEKCLSQAVIEEANPEVC